MERSGRFLENLFRGRKISRMGEFGFRKPGTFVNNLPETIRANISSGNTPKF